MQSYPSVLSLTHAQRFFLERLQEKLLLIVSGKKVPAEGK